MRQISAEKHIENITGWIRNWFDINGPEAKAVIGISGGKDSTIAAALLVNALGIDRVYGVLMPNGEQADINDSYKVVELLGIDHCVIDIREAYEAILTGIIINSSPLDGIDLSDESAIEQKLKDTKINIPPRIRMTVLYGIAQSIEGGGRVVNTCNRSEDYIGYSTKYGDAAGDFSLFANLTVREVLAIGDALGLPYELVHKIPSDGLCGQTDEDKIGFKYEELDEYLLTGNGKQDVIDKIEKMHRMNLHKIRPMPAYGVE